MLSASITSAIILPISSNSSSLKPLVVPAGVPNLIPDVLEGGKVSKGIEFLFTVIWILSRASVNSLPLIFLDDKSTKTRCVSVPSVTRLIPRFFRVSPNALAFFIT